MRVSVFPASNWAGTNTKTAITVFGSCTSSLSQKAGNLEVCKTERKKKKRERDWGEELSPAFEKLNEGKKKISWVSSFFLFLKNFANLQG